MHFVLQRQGGSGKGSVTDGCVCVCAWKEGTGRGCGGALCWHLPLACQGFNRVARPVDRRPLLQRNKAFSQGWNPTHPLRPTLRGARVPEKNR